MKRMDGARPGRGGRVCRCGLSLLALALASLLSSPAAGMEFISSKELKPGMKGYGLSVFRGTKIERFEVEVLGVLANFLPKQDIILIMMDHPLLRRTGVIAGMSGSPVFIGDKLAGAVAYGWSFPMDPIAGVTPIHNMLAEMRRPLHGPSPVGRIPARRAALPRPFGAPLLATKPGAGPLATPDPTSLLSGALPGTRLLPPPGELAPLSVPITFSGLSPRVLEDLRESLAPYRIVPMAGGGSGHFFSDAKARFEPGAAFGVEYVRGDIGGVGTGTVTYVEGSKVAAFGHPMVEAGELRFPVVTSYIQWVVASSMHSFKLSTRLDEAGSLIQDRTSCVIADMGSRAPMVPVVVSVRDGRDGRVHLFHTEVVRHRLFSPMLALAVLRNAISTAAPDADWLTMDLTLQIKLVGYPPFTLEDSVLSPTGTMSIGALYGATGIRALVTLLSNPYEPAAFERIDAGVALDYAPPFSKIVGAYVLRDEVRPGERINLYVRTLRYGVTEEVRTLPYEVPPDTEGLELAIDISAGQETPPIVAPPKSLAGLIENMRKAYPPRSLVVRTKLPDGGAIYEDRLLPALPSSVFDALRPSSSTSREASYRLVEDKVHPVSELLTGKTSIKIVVADDLK